MRGTGRLLWTIPVVAGGALLWGATSSAAHAQEEKAKSAGQSIAGAAANARTTTTIKAKFVTEPGLPSFSINVDTTDGLVTLSGKVESHEQVARAVKLALETDGVHKVISTLQIVPVGK